jgi:hemerythrin-like domain-containing protein
MQPIGPLMIEHRLIERMIALVGRRAYAAEQTGDIDPIFIDSAVDFVRVYADRTHHGKEEEILFRDLASRDLSDVDRRAMEGLIEDHKLGRRTVADLAAANERYRRGDEESLPAIIEKLRFLAEFYPTHIEKEDKVFFPASMQYFDRAERDAMLAEMWEFDRGMIHEKYKAVVEGLE